MKSPNLKFIFGIILIVCGWIICFDVFLLIIGLAFFLLGTILVLFSKKSLLVKSIVVGLPIIFWFVGFEIILHEINKPTQITILIPENFSGEFRIIEGEKNGLVPAEENGRTTLTIPENGILITQAHLNLKQSSNFEFYYVDASKQRTKINFDSARKYVNVKFPLIVFNGVMSPPQDDGVSSDVARKLDYLYDSFSIYKTNYPAPKPELEAPDMEAYAEKKQDVARMDSLVKIERGIK